jgi:hypothetical protein
MEITDGWAFNYGNEKFVVTVDETDVRRMIVARLALLGAPRSREVIEELALTFHTEDVYAMLQADAAAFTAHSLSQRPATKPEERADLLRQLKARRAEREAVLDKYLPRPARQAEPEPAEPATASA